MPEALPSHHEAPGGRFALLIRSAVAASAVVFVAPLGVGVVEVVGAGAPGLHTGRLLRSIGWAALIATLATALALPLAQWLAGGWWRLAAAVLPVLVPPYLAHAGWSELRGPGTWTGDWLLQQAEAGRAWMTIAFGRASAVLGLSVWVAPIGAVVIAVASRRLGTQREAVTLEARGAASWWAMVRAMRPALVTAWLLIGALMLGSAVPLHLAQVGTLALEAWLALSLGDRGGAWSGSWPTLVAAVVAGVFVSRSMLADPDDDASVDEARAASPGASPGASSVRSWAGWLVLALGVAAPMLLFVLMLRRWGSLIEVLEPLMPRLVGSGAIAVVVGVAAVVLTLLVSAADRKSRAVIVTAALVAGLMPGVLVGDAWLRMGQVAGLSDRAMLVLAMVCRVGFVAVLVGHWLATVEPRSMRDQFRIDGGGAGAWWEVFGPGRWAAACGAGLLCGVLSLHEIEASVLLAPPGRGHLARFMLDLLHYQRNESLAAGVLWIGTVSIVIGALATLVLRRGTVHAIESRAERNGRGPERKKEA